MDDEHNLKQNISSIFKLSGFTIRRDANSYLVEQLQSLESSEALIVIDKVISHVLKQDLTQTIVEKVNVEAALKECTSSGLEESESVFHVIDAFSVPKFNYDLERKKFVKDGVNSNTIELFSSAKWKANFMQQRYTIIWQRTVRNKLFSPEVLPGFGSEKTFNLLKIEAMLSSSNRIKEVIALGLLTQLTETDYYLEDPTGCVPLDISKARYHSGLFTEHSFVLAEGYYEDKVLYVTGFVLPPTESRANSMIYYGSLNTFGGSSKTLLKNSENLLRIENENENGMIIFLSDVWLDDIKVIEKLKTLFSGFNDFPPIAIVFTGDYLSRPYGFETCSQLKAAFKTLGDIISQHTRLVEFCKFVFVPGIRDPPGLNILPRVSIPKCLTEDIRQKLGESVYFTTNPCRIQYCTQEIVVMRHDLVTKMCRNAIHFPETGDIPDHLTKTLLSQCTLAPLPLSVQPLYWQHADALGLYPVPDLVVVADHFQPYKRTYQNCHLINPGSFPRTEYSFKVYIPASRTVEDSQIPKDTD